MINVNMIRCSRHDIRHNPISIPGPTPPPHRHGRQRQPWHNHFMHDAEEAQPINVWHDLFTPQYLRTTFALSWYLGQGTKRWAEAAILMARPGVCPRCFGTPNVGTPNVDADNAELLGQPRNI